VTRPSIKQTLLCWSFIVLSAHTLNTARADNSIVIGSKKFTESVILGEIARHLMSDTGYTAQHRRELGGTRVLWSALLAGEIDLYPDYTGTLMQEILAGENVHTLPELRAALETRGLRMTPPLGFNNTYAIGVKKTLAEKRNLKTISDLREHPDLILGFGSEFMNRSDGWPGLQQRYQLPHTNVRGMDHDLAYRGIDSGTLHVMDLYATDAEIDYYNLIALQDDLAYFPDYDAVFVYRAELQTTAPQVVKQLQRLAGKIEEPTMIKLNARVKIQREPESKVANDFIEENFGIRSAVQTRTAWDKFKRHTVEHLTLVAISLFAAIVISLPLGIVAAQNARLGRVILGVTGIIQTIPSLALFVFMIPLLGIGGPPAVIALFLYSLLPIVQNTHAGLTNIPSPIRESAQALGLPLLTRLRLIDLPLSVPTIIAGIKTSAVLNIGTATLAALIGAGGYGQPILTGIRLDDIGLILQGAVPAAVLALLVQGLFEAVERIILPRGLHAVKN
jgi:osmoprotectant transport system permease protein